MLPIFQWIGPSGDPESGYTPAHWQNFFTGDIYQSPNWYYVGQSGDPESGIESAHYINASTGESVGVDDLYASPYAPGSPPLAQQYGTAESVRAYGGYDRFTGLIGADGYPQNKQDVLDAETARRNADSSVWAQVGPGVVNTALFVGTVLGAEALYNYATGPVLPEATSAPDFTSADEVLSMPEKSGFDLTTGDYVWNNPEPTIPEYSAFEDLPAYDASLDPSVSVPDFTSADEALNVSESFTQEAQTLATENIAAPAVQQAAQQTVAASTAAATAVQSGSTAATIKGYLAAAAAALSLTRQAVSAYRNPTYGGQINPATGQPYGYGAINPATGQPYGYGLPQGAQYATSGQSLLLPLAAIAALFLLKG